jgi:hypothetical protein
MTSRFWIPTGLEVEAAPPEPEPITDAEYWMKRSKAFVEAVDQLHRSYFMSLPIEFRNQLGELIRKSQQW